MKKAIFTYKKDGETSAQRVVFKPTLLKESTNSLTDYENPNVKYIHGLELDKSNLDSKVISEYEKIIDEYFNIKYPTLQEFIAQNGLDPEKIKHKSFKKENIENIQFI